MIMAQHKNTQAHIMCNLIHCLSLAEVTSCDKCVVIIDYNMSLREDIVFTAQARKVQSALGQAQYLPTV